MKEFLQRLLGRKPVVAATVAAPATRRETRPSFEDAGIDDEIIRLFSPEETAHLRTQFLTGHFQRAIEACLAKDSTLQSVTLTVGQYWCDEALDAVQPELVWSELDTPDLEAAAIGNRDDWEEGKPPKTEFDVVNLSGRSSWDLFDYKIDPTLEWEANMFCIPLFAAYCIGGAHQEGDYLEFESPVAIYRRTGPESASMEFVGEMARPWLDGVDFAAGGESVDVAAVEEWIAKGRRRW